MTVWVFCFVVVLDRVRLIANVSVIEGDLY